MVSTIVVTDVAETIAVIAIVYPIGVIEVANTIVVLGLALSTATR